MSTRLKVHIVGGGLAGSEAAYFLARHGVQVFLHEMRPQKMTPAHQTGRCAELVCSNTFKSKAEATGPGILKQEMSTLGSLILQSARKAEVPAGQALAVDRDKFSEIVTKVIDEHPSITRYQEEVTQPFDDAPTLFATGPLSSDRLTEWLMTTTGEEDLYFYDAIAPIVDASTINHERTFLANRYDKGGETAYLNCPFSKEEYYRFIDALLQAEKVAAQPFEKEKFFQGCQPIEAIAEKGRDSLRFGSMKPVGLTDPRTGEQPFAVVQLRPENQSRSAYNLVGFQTRLKYGEQREILRMIPGLENAKFYRFGSIHRNTYLCGPKILRGDLSIKKHPQVYVAGQVSGVEGYLESAACGMLAATFLLQRLNGLTHSAPPATTAMGALLRHVISGNIKNFQPSNIHFGLFDPPLFQGLTGLKRQEARAEIARQAAENLKAWWKKQKSRLPLATEEPSPLRQEAY